MLKRQEILKHWSVNQRVEILKEVFEANKNETDFLPQLILYLKLNLSTEIASTWLIKHALSKQLSYESKDIDLLGDLATSLQSWQSQLHLLQIIQKLKFTKAQAVNIQGFVERCLTHKQKFVCAEAFASYAKICHVIPELKPEFLAYCKIQQDKVSAAIKVKIRRILSES